MLGASADPKGHWAPDFAALRQNPAQARGLKKVEEKNPGKTTGQILGKTTGWFLNDLNVLTINFTGFLQMFASSSSNSRSVKCLYVLRSSL